MVQMTFNVSDGLAERLQPLGTWLPTVLELTLVGCKTVAAATATEVLEFLAQGPTPEEVLAYRAGRAQNQLQRLLAQMHGVPVWRKSGGTDELQQIGHIIIMLKAQLASSGRSPNGSAGACRIRQEVWNVQLIDILRSTAEVCSHTHERHIAPHQHGEVTCKPGVGVPAV